MNPAWTNKFDFALLFDSLHDQGRPDLCLQEVKFVINSLKRQLFFLSILMIPILIILNNKIHRVLKPDGAIILVDIDMHTNVYENMENPMSAVLYAASLLHCMPISLVGLSF